MVRKIEEKNYAISMVRLIATALIVLCHIERFFEHPLALWFNVGVQIFLCMSGYLYGQKKLNGDELSFYKKQFSKILLDYYIVIIPMIILYYICAKSVFSWVPAARTLFAYGPPFILGGGHLWYVQFCLVCYLFTPLLARIFDKIFEGAVKEIVIKSILFGILVFILFETFFRYFTSAWIMCYVFGFFLGRLFGERRYLCLSRGVTLIIIALAIIMNTIQIVQDYILHYELTEMTSLFYLYFCNYAHTFLGCSLFVILKIFFSHIFGEGCPFVIQTICSWSDRISYDIYLVHEFFLEGPFALIAITACVPINIAIFLTATIMSAVLINQVSALTIRWLKRNRFLQ